MHEFRSPRSAIRRVGKEFSRARANPLAVVSGVGVGVAVRVALLYALSGAAEASELGSHLTVAEAYAATGLIVVVSSAAAAAAGWFTYRWIAKEHAPNLGGRPA